LQAAILLALVEVYGMAGAYEHGRLGGGPECGRQAAQRAPEQTAAVRLVARHAVLLEEDDARARLGEHPRRSRAGGPASDDGDVEILRHARYSSAIRSPERYHVGSPPRRRTFTRPRPTTVATASSTRIIVPSSMPTTGLAFTTWYSRMRSSRVSLPGARTGSVSR